MCCNLRHVLAIWGLVSVSIERKRLRVRFCREGKKTEGKEMQEWDGDGLEVSAKLAGVNRRRDHIRAR